MDETLQTASGPPRPYRAWLVVLGAIGSVAAAAIGIVPWLVDYFSSPPKKPQSVLVIRELTVNEKSGSDKLWDPSRGLPDLIVIVENRTTGEKIKTPIARDTLTKTYDLRTVTVREDDQVRIKVVDEDGYNLDDVVGSITFRVTAARLRQRAEALQFEQVAALKIDYAAD